MMKYLRILVCGLALQCNALPALANFNMSPSGSTIAFAIDAGNQGTALCAAGSTECPASVPINTAGAPLFVSGTPGFVTGAGGTFPVTNVTAANLNATVIGTGTFAVQAGQTGTWTVQPGNTANTTAWLVTGTGGTFPATQSGNWTSRVVGNTGTTLDFAGQNAGSPGASLLTGCQFNNTPTGISNGNSSPVQCDTNGNTLVNIKAGTVAATQSGTWTVQPGNTANTTAWLVTGTGGTFPVTQTTASNLNATVVGTGTFATQSTLAAETTKVIGTVRTLGNAGAIFDGATGAAVPANVIYMGINSGGNLAGWNGAVTGTVTANAGTNLNTSALATSANQTNASQKTQIVDGSGNVIASTSNNLNVQCANCSGSGVSTGDKASFTGGTSLFAGSGGFFETTGTANTLTTGQQGMFQVTANRALFTNLRNAAGAEVGVAAAPLQVSVANTAANGTAILVTGTGGTFPSTLAASSVSSGAYASGSIASGAVASGAFAAGSIAAGAYVSGSILSGALASGAVVDITNMSQTIGSAVPAKAIYAGLSDGTNIRGWLNAANALNSTGAGVGTAQIVGQFDDVTPTSITENQFGNIRMSANRNVYQTIRDAAGNERGVNVTAANELLVTGAVTNAGTFAVQAAATLAAETTKVIGTVRNLGNAGAIFDAATGAAAPANALQMGMAQGGNLVALTGTSGNLNVNIASGGGSGGTSITDNAAFTTGTTAETPIGCYAGTPSATANHSTIVACTTAGSVHTTVDNTNANGSATSANSSPVVIASDQVAVAIKAASGTIASGAIASGAVASGAFAAGSIAAGAYVSGSILSGALASGAVVDITNMSQTIASAVPAKAIYLGLSDGTNIRGWLNAANALNSTGAGVGTAQIVGQFDDVTPTSITENQFGNIRMSANRNVYQTIRDAAGNERGANVTASNELLVTGAVTIAGNQAVNVAQINGVTPLMGNGVTGTGSQRVTIASDNTAFAVNATLQTGANIVGRVGVDQTTPGTTNAVSLAQIGANTVSSGNGASGTGTLRVAIANDNTVLPGVGAGATGSAVPANAAYQGNIYNSAPISAPTSGNLVGEQADLNGNVKTAPGITTQTLTAITSATGTGAITPSILVNHGAPAVALQLVQTTTITGGAVTIQGTYDGTNWVTVPLPQVVHPQTFVQLTNPYTFVASTNQPFLILTQGFQAIRLNLTSALTGTGSVTPQVTQLPYLPATGVVAQASTTAGQGGSLVQGAVTTNAPTYTTAQTSPLSLDTHGGVRIGGGGYPAGATPITASATGTTAATTATLATGASVTTYICGFSIRANATAAATANSTVTGTITGTLNFTQWTAPLASGIGLTEEIFVPCVPASAANTSIAVVSAAPGTGGVVSVTAWGFQL